MSTPIILYRPLNETSGETKSLTNSCLDYTFNRTTIPKDSLVIGRYSVLPFYKELCSDLEIQGSKLINDFKEHSWIANFDWYHTLKKYTFPSYKSEQLSFINTSNHLYHKAWVVKGITNSLKHSWNTHMYAKDLPTAHKVACNIRQDSLVGSQDIIYREYVPLETFEIGINDLPFTNEWRFFFFKDQLIDYGYYWSNAERLLSKVELPQEGLEFAKHISSIVRNYTNFYVLDIARTEKGDWILVEINDGQMSGLSSIDPDSFYSNLKLTLNKLFH